MQQLAQLRAEADRGLATARRFRHARLQFVVTGVVDNFGIFVFFVHRHTCIGQPTGKLRGAATGIHHHIRKDFLAESFYTVFPDLDPTHLQLTCMLLGDQAIDMNFIEDLNARKGRHKSSKYGFNGGPATHQHKQLFVTTLWFILPAQLR